MAESREDKALVHSNQRLAVYRLQDERGQLRCLREHAFSSNADCQQEVERFRLMQRLSHPNICQVLRVEETEVAAGWLLTVEMEWCGQDLESLTRSQYPQGWDQDRATQVLLNILAALTHAQEQGVCHRDVKPSNLYETATGYKVADFGSAKYLDSSLMSHSLAGTPLFLSPILRRAFSQTLLGDAVSHVDHNPFKSDVYSLGLTLVYLLQPSVLAKLGNQTELGKVVSALPIHPSFSDTLRRMLAPEEADRPDFIGLTAHIEQLQAAQEPAAQIYVAPESDMQLPEAAAQEPADMRQFQELPKEEVKAAAAESLERVRELNEGEIEPPVSAQLEPGFESEERRTAATTQNRSCPACGEAFILNMVELWRLQLIGSDDYTECKEYCSSPCFQRRSVAPSASRPIEREQPPEEPASEGPRRQDSSIPAQDTLLHCHQHREMYPLFEYIGRRTPTVFPQCSTCELGELTQESLSAIDQVIVRNSLYPGLVFLVILSESEDAGCRECYCPISASAVTALAAGLCHFCTAQVNPSRWLAFAHNNSIALVCSLDCIRQVGRTRQCPSCEAPLIVLKSFPASGHLILEKVETMESCDLCYCGPCDYVLSCEHCLCQSCAAYIPKIDFSMFSCPYCWKMLQKSEHASLFEQ